jgi:hypothetical protein
MMDKLQKYFEPAALLMILLSLAGLYAQSAIAQGVSVALVSLLAFYWLASGILVLLDRANVEQVMRLTWFMGMWSAAIGLLGIISRILLWSSNKSILMVSGAMALTAIAFSILNRQGLEGDLREAFDREMRPLYIRLLPVLLVGTMIYFTDARGIYSNFGLFRDDPEYVRLLMEKIDNPQNRKAVDAWKAYHTQKRLEMSKRESAPDE